MKNKIQYIEERNIGAVREKALESPKTRLVEIDGSKYECYADFVEFLEVELSFPRKCGRNTGYTNRCDDWMRDLLWEDYDEYVFIIYNYKWFLFNDCFGKGVFFSSFEEYTKFWEYGVEHCMVGGKCKGFNLYLWWTKNIIKKANSTAPNGCSNITVTHQTECLSVRGKWVRKY